MRLRRLSVPVALLFCFVPDAAAGAASPESSDAFERQIRPLLIDRCYACHSAAAKSVKGGLRLDTRAGLLRGGESGFPSVTPGDPAKSKLIEAVRYRNADLQMPPKERLAAREVTALETWVTNGAPMPDDATARTVSPAAADKHWSFQPLKPVAPPAVKGDGYCANDVDRFILAKLESKGLKPSPPADRRTLLRRATLDLTGLPPTPAEIAAFEVDASPEAYAKLIDRLLASPAYGERWGRHWLDVARYADTAGDGADYPVREAYKYRDYVIEAFNRDLPYDQFLREQIAGDLLAAQGPADDYARRVTATGFIAVGKRFGYLNTSDQFKHLDIADTIDVVGKSVLGLSIGCARCHDHKYEPVTAADYYALYGIFNSTTYTFPGGEEYKKPYNLVPLVPPQVAAPLEREWRAQLAALDARIKAAQADRTALAAKRPATAPATSPASPQRLAGLDQSVARLRGERDALAARPPVEYAYAVAEGKAADAKIQLRGEPTKLGAVVPRGFPAILGGQRLPPGCKTSGRLELAGWLTDPANPLTARVMVNRIWQHHFGRGIVPTPSDFGTRGAPPSHPELLDYLAVQFVKDGWSVKAVHRRIMLSATYQQSSSPQSAIRNSQSAIEHPQSAIDLLASFPPRRLESEAIRDAMLAAAGTLDRTPAGPHPFPPVERWGFTIHNPFYAVYESNRRSVYLMVQRQKRHPFLALFDGADPNVSTDARLTTVTPAQALFLMNSPFVHEQSTALAKRLLAEAPDDQSRLRLAHDLTTGHPPDPDDVAHAGAFLQRYRLQLAAARKTVAEQDVGAWAAYARVLLTSNAFLFLD